MAVFYYVMYYSVQGSEFKDIPSLLFLLENTHARLAAVELKSMIFIPCSTPLNALPKNVPPKTVEKNVIQLSNDMHLHVNVNVNVMSDTARRLTQIDEEEVEGGEEVKEEEEEETAEVKDRFEDYDKDAAKRQCDRRDMKDERNCVHSILKGYRGRKLYGNSVDNITASRANSSDYDNSNGNSNFNSNSNVTTASVDSVKVEDGSSRSGSGSGRGRGRGVGTGIEGGGGRGGSVGVGEGDGMGGGGVGKGGILGTAGSVGGVEAGTGEGVGAGGGGTGGLGGGVGSGGIGDGSLFDRIHNSIGKSVTSYDRFYLPYCINISLLSYPPACFIISFPSFVLILRVTLVLLYCFLRHRWYW